MMYADDMMLSLINLTEAVQLFKEELLTLNQNFGLWINFKNTLCCNIPSAIQLKAFHTLNIPIVYKSFRYLEISIPKKSK